MVNCKGSNSSIHSSSIQQWIKASVFSQAIEIDLPTAGSFELLDMNGKLALAPTNYSLENGEHSLTLDTENVANGLYIIELKINGVVSRYRISVIH